jgi:sorbitol-specific phosphotransferase system component IIBC
MKSEENSLQRLQIIKQAQMGMSQEITTFAQQNALTPMSFKKLRKPYEDMLYVLGVKNADIYLPTEKETMEMIQQSKQAAQQAQQAQQQMAQQAHQTEMANKTAKTQLDQVRAQQIVADTQGNSAKMQLDGFSLVGEHKARAF